MFDGIYCKEKNSYEIYESIFIDEFKKCISSATSSQSQAMELNSSNHTTISSNPEKWQVGMNVRAMYNEDGKFYEAIIEKILDENLAVVRFHGYNDEETVNIKTFLPSRGEKAIKTQIEDIPDSEEQIDEYDGSWKKTDWKVGMACRALYEKNDTIYEATIVKIDENEHTALLEMTGYGTYFTAAFENMYESILEYRVKQEFSAKNYIDKQSKNSEVFPAYVHQKKNASICEDSGSKISFADHTGNLKKAKDNNSINELIGFHSENDLPIPLASEGIMQPENESEAFACLISANYLSGYYAGYYDCIRKRHNLYKS